MCACVHACVRACVRVRVSVRVRVRVRVCVCVTCSRKFIDYAHNYTTVYLYMASVHMHLYKVQTVYILCQRVNRGFLIEIQCIPKHVEAYKYTMTSL